MIDHSQFDRYDPFSRQILAPLVRVPRKEKQSARERARMTKVTTWGSHTPGFRYKREVLQERKTLRDPLTTQQKEQKDPQSEIWNDIRFTFFNFLPPPPSPTSLKFPSRTPCSEASTKKLVQHVQARARTSGAGVLLELRSRILRNHEVI